MRTKAILSYPPPKNQKQLRKFRHMQLPPPVRCELLAIRSTFVDAFAQREQMELVLHDAKSF
jgi:hypothetical protein